MVKRADLIQSDRLSDKRKVNNFENLKNRKYEKIPVYPSKVQTTAFPEKAYIFAIEKLILISIVLFALSVMLGFAIYYKTFLFKPNPLFIYYSEYENQFKVKNFYSGNLQAYHNAQLLAEDFLQKWIADYYSIVPDKNANEKKWCDCLVAGANGQAKNFADGECSVCTQSDSSVYSVFAEFAQPVMATRADNRVVRLVKILDVESFNFVAIDHSVANASMLQGLMLSALGSFGGNSDRATPFRSYLFYIKVDFAVVDFKDGFKLGEEFFTTYNTVNLRLNQDMVGRLTVNKNWDKNFKVLEHGANFILHKKYADADMSDLQKQYEFLMRDFAEKNALKIVAPIAEDQNVVKISPEAAEEITNAITEKMPEKTSVIKAEDDGKNKAEKPSRTDKKIAPKKDAKNPAGVRRAPVKRVAKELIKRTTNQRR